MWRRLMWSGEGVREVVVRGVVVDVDVGLMRALWLV